MNDNAFAKKDAFAETLEMRESMNGIMSHERRGTFNQVHSRNKDDDLSSPSKSSGGMRRNKSLRREQSA